MDTIIKNVKHAKLDIKTASAFWNAETFKII